MIYKKDPQKAISYAEQYGISDVWKENATEMLKIDSEIQVDSLNASGAAAIGMWELYKNHD